MITIPVKYVIDSARKKGLVFWQITDAGNEIARQDEEISLEDSLQLLEETINELKDNARTGDKIKVSMQSMQMSGGRKKGMQLGNWFIYLKEPESKQMQGIGNLNLIEENIRLKMTMEHEKEKESLIKRIEALENTEEDGEGFEKVINGLNNLMASPATQLLIGLMMNGKAAPAAAAPAINGLPITDYKNLIERIEKIDPEFIQMLEAIVISAEENPAGYNFYRQQLVKQKK